MIRVVPLLLVALLQVLIAGVQAAEGIRVRGQVTDPEGNPVADLRVQLVTPNGRGVAQEHVTDKDGYFEFQAAVLGKYTLQVSVPGFQELSKTVEVTGSEPLVKADVRLGNLSTRQESITVTADVREANVLYPDPAQRVYVRQETLDANPGRPGAPISIPGVPIETASGGIKAPQYFSPGVAGDHGEPIAEYIQVGTYLLSNNLSSNAHGNGYADPNILVPAILAGVQTDGGAFNVREGNHAENLSAIYQLRSRLEPFVTVTGDYRDIDVVAGWSPEKVETKSWVALEAAYGNGFLDRPEHRQQCKLNGFREFDWGRHQLTLFGIGYYGFSYVPGLVPIDTSGLDDTIDQRQRDQTHTGELGVNDIWHWGETQQLQLSALFRTYNLSLYSNFGDGLIRQSEFRTVTGGNATYIKRFTRSMTLMAGTDYQRDAPRRLDLDHYPSTDESLYGPFEKVTANNVTLGDTAPYLSLDGSLFKNLHYDLGWRPGPDPVQQRRLVASGELVSHYGGLQLAESDGLVPAAGRVVAAGRGAEFRGSILHERSADRNGDGARNAGQPGARVPDGGEQDVLGDGFSGDAGACDDGGVAGEDRSGYGFAAGRGARPEQIRNCGGATLFRMGDGAGFGFEGGREGFGYGIGDAGSAAVAGGCFRDGQQAAVWAAGAGGVRGSRGETAGGWDSERACAGVSRGAGAVVSGAADGFGIELFDCERVYGSDDGGAGAGGGSAAVRESGGGLSAVVCELVVYVSISAAGGELIYSSLRDVNQKVRCNKNLPIAYGAEKKSRELILGCFPVIQNVLRGQIVSL